MSADRTSISEVEAIVSEKPASRRRSQGAASNVLFESVKLFVRIDSIHRPFRKKN